LKCTIKFQEYRRFEDKGVPLY